jgi:membrane protease YdiL (CAAX protease family)
MLPPPGWGPELVPTLRAVGTLDPAPPAPTPPRPGFAWRLLSPLGAVVLAFVLLVVVAVALEAADRSDQSAGAVLAFGSSLLLLLFGVALRRGLPAHERRLTIALKRSARGAIGLGLGIGAGIIVAMGVVFAVGQAIDPGLERRFEDLDEDIGTAPWQLVLTFAAIVVLAPLGEELLFRGLVLRALARRIRFWPAALISSAFFAAAHLDAYLLWPRAIALVGTGVALAWLYRRRGYWASVTAHGTVNVVAWIAMVATS